MTNIKYSHTSAFFWNTKLSIETQEQLVDWCKSLNEEDQKKLELLLEDTRLNTDWDTAQEYSIY